MKSMLLILVVVFSFNANAKVETRCGFIENPTPGNFWLFDPAGSWTMGVQGGYQAQGLDNLEYAPDDQYVNTNGNYGYFCGCVTGDMNMEEMTIDNITSSKSQLLKTCLEDGKLMDAYYAY